MLVVLVIVLSCLCLGAFVGWGVTLALMGHAQAALIRAKLEDYKAFDLIVRTDAYMDGKIAEALGRYKQLSAQRAASGGIGAPPKTGLDDRGVQQVGRSMATVVAPFIDTGSGSGEALGEQPMPVEG